MKVAAAVTTMGLQECMLEVVQGASSVDILFPITVGDPPMHNHLATDVGHHLSTMHATQIPAITKKEQMHGPYMGKDYSNRKRQRSIGRKQHLNMTLEKSLEENDLESEQHLAILAQSVDYERSVEFVFNGNPPHDPDETPGAGQWEGGGGGEDEEQVFSETS
eukprot:TRINITY_DN6003_c0_g1_i1.p2 TRINITY_DN6003_c0_g1~~TRINITY_DN6003_c0_g1_i1.p2  ORF type:complete len:163 (-),score=40.71 TRINITY_DN6003_c0_g1_i1:244-732(-)